ncbi:MAG: flagellar biosynthetic protein FliO [bacterium]|nr:flagellar biosynthetic protein FliO [bacterium]
MMITLASSHYLNSMIELITVLVIFVFVLLLTYYVTRWIAGYQKTKLSQGNLSIVEAIRVSNNQSIQIIRAGKEKYLVVAVGKEQTTLLATMTKEELDEIQEIRIQNGSPKESFQEIFDKLKDRLPKK